MDREQLKKRLGDSSRVIAKGWEPDPQARRDILKERAAALARPARGDDGEEAGLEILEFALAGERYGIETISIREVFNPGEVTPVPCTPAFVLGMVNVRGQILSVVDLKIFFDLPASVPGELSRVVIVGDGVMEFGLLADEVLGVRTVPLSGIQPSLPTIGGVSGEYLRGITADRTIILDVAAVLADAKIVVNEVV